jgi:hypothetical protein
LSWVALGFTFLLLGATTALARRYAHGWITLVGDDALRIDADGASATLKLRPGVATLRAVENATQYVQLDIDDGTAQAHVWGMVGFRGLKYLAGGLTPARGLMVATSMAPLCHRLAPYFVKAQ